MAREAFSVDLNKPLFLQVGHLGEAYEKWVHQPIFTKESPRLFKNDLMESLTRTPWWAVPLVWAPLVWWFLSYSSDIPPIYMGSTFALGFFLWTFMEYLIHRFLFHQKTTTYWGNTLHYLFHGCHHKHPMDGLRLVMPPAAVALVVELVWNLIKLVVPTQYSHVLAGGILFGYIIYDCTHYYVHHGKTTTGVFYRIKGYHMKHHFGNMNTGFGVTTTFWDWIFGTFPQKSTDKEY